MEGYRIQAFRFESLLDKLKKKLNSGFKPLEQVCRSILEDELLDLKQPASPNIFEVLSCQRRDDDLFVIKKIKYRQFTITLKPPNNVVALKDGRIVSIENMFVTSKNFKELKQINVQGKFLKLNGSAFTYPTDSSLLGIYKVKGTDVDVKFTFSEIDSKLIFLNIFRSLSEKQELKNLYVMPFLHYNES